MTPPRGIVLIQALVLVAALSAAAVLLLSRAETGTARDSAALATDQRALMLDAGEAMARAALADDFAHGFEPITDAPRPLGLGTVVLTVDDPQGRFNLNWLADGGDAAAVDALARLVSGLGLPPSTTQALAEALRADGAVLLPEQALASLSRDAADRLAPHVAALPVGSRLDLNRATGPLLAALLPGLSPADRARLRAARDRAPFASLAAAGTLAGAALPPDRFTVRPRFVRVTVTVRLDDRRQTRMTLFDLHPESGPSGERRVLWRMAADP